MKFRAGHKLLAIRESMHKSQAEFAEMLNIPTSTYSRYERNENQLDFEILQEFAQKLNVSAFDLLPEIFAFNNNTKDTHGTIGCVWGTNNVTNNYYHSQDSLPAAHQENAQLRAQLTAQNEKIAALETQLKQLLEKLGN